MNGYQHLGLDERRDLYRLMATGRSVRQIAGALRRHPSTIYREFKRNRHLDEHPLFRGYFSQPLCKSWLADAAFVVAKLHRGPNLPPISQKGFSTFDASSVHSMICAGSIFLPLGGGRSSRIRGKVNRQANIMSLKSSR